MVPIPKLAASPFIPPKAGKANNRAVTKSYLDQRAARAIALGYSKPRWVLFCQIALDRGFAINLYEARRTNSKYVTVWKGSKSFKVRFSDHKPIKAREAGGDCDFFVGVTNLAVTTTGDALRALFSFFGEAA